MRDPSADDPRFFKALNDLKQAMTFQNRGMFDEAEKAFAHVVKKNPQYFDALHFYGLFKYQRGQFNEAVKLIRKAIALNPRSVNALSSLGVVLAHLGRESEALASLDAVLKLAPDHLPALVNRCNILNELGRYDETLTVSDHVLKIDPNSIEAYILRGAALFQLHRYLEALENYEHALKRQANSVMALVGRANVFSRLKRHEEALAAYQRALALKPDLADAWLGCAHIFLDCRHYDEALAAYDKALALTPALVNAWSGRGVAFSQQGRYTEAVAAYDKALALKPALAGTEGMRLHAKMHLCDWRNFDADRTRLLSAVKNGIEIDPFVLLAASSSPDLQLQCAKSFSDKRYVPFQKMSPQHRHFGHDRIRIAYLSADFGDHPMSYLTVGMYENHDHNRFETFAISFRRRDETETLARLKACFDQFIDVTDRNDIDVAQMLRTLEIDIAVDLMGYTTNSRPAILAQRAAPVQVNYLGYPGTMGASFIDYIVADNFVIPDTQREFCTEKIIYLPEVFQANDSKRRIDRSPASRSEVGLPENAFVFCSFNNSYKITPDCFDVWMRLLRQVDGSVLWLLGRDDSLENNLLREAENRGVSASRLIFAHRKAYANYLAQYRLADLFLDTFAFNAGTTASDALWAGLPIITCPGNSFASRMAGSLLKAVGLPELIAESVQGYETLARDLACNRDRLTSIKGKLEANIPGCSLFNTELFTRRMEAAYIAIYERFQMGLPADHLFVLK
ncbi:MAG TPA: tetratricopeptide repeat protein [Acidobacteriota bacterium]|nr:tetratricopeptide repeat protein [Acidobacteriota bacterium]